MTFKQSVGIGTVAVVLFGWATPIGAVDGVKLISQSNALAGNVTPGDAPGFPVTISLRGSYQLSSDLTVPADTNGIEITADDVTLNLNGWSITGAGGSEGHGVDVSNSNQRATILNGTVQGMARFGVVARNFARIERVRAVSNGVSGISVGIGSTVTDNAAIGNGFDGIFTGSGSIVTGNMVMDNGSRGIFASLGSTVTGNLIRNNNGVGLQAGGNTGYAHNVFSGNAGGSVGGGESLGQNLCEGVVC